MRKPMLIICSIILVFLFAGCNFSEYAWLQHDGADLLGQDAKSEIIDAFKQNKTLLVATIEEIQNLYITYDRQTMYIRLLDDGSVFISCGDPAPSETEQIEAVIDSPNLKKLFALSTIKTIVVRKSGIEFAGDGAGFGPNTSYCGVFFSPSGDITAIPYYDDGMLFTEENGCVYGTQRNGDNSVYIEQIEENYFYYEAIF